ncbi:hypothetical protein Tco_1119177 [Tanacetum coccineum]
MAQLKYCDKHNQVGFLLKPTESAGYTEIVDFLRRSKLRYALTHNPPIYDSLVKQFWQTATARTLADGTQQLDATIDTIEYTITEESVRRQLQLADASGIHMLQNEEIFAGLQNIGSKSGGWDQFGSNIATALICLSTGRDFNFSKLIFDGMISNLKGKSKFLMYPRFLQMILNVQTENKNLFVPVSLTKKIFGNMKRGFQGIHRPLLPVMLTIDAGQPQPSADPTPSQSRAIRLYLPATSHMSAVYKITQDPPITLTSLLEGPSFELYYHMSPTPFTMNLDSSILRSIAEDNTGDGEERVQRREKEGANDLKRTFKLEKQGLNLFMKKSRGRRSKERKFGTRRKLNDKKEKLWSHNEKMMDLINDEEVAMVVELVKFVKQHLKIFEDSNDDDTVTSTHEDAEQGLSVG